MLFEVVESFVPEVLKVRTKVNQLFDRQTEMDATIRVLMYVIEAAWDVPDVTIQLQPSVFKHSVFTDVSFVFKGERLLGFIEIKKIEVNTNLHMEMKPTASYTC